jgi:hypothetical protein
VKPLTNTPHTRVPDFQAERLQADDEVPRHHKRALKPRRKKYGIEHRNAWLKTWGTCRRWYATEAARDKALADLIKHTRNLLRDIGPVPRYRKVDC